MPSHKNNKHNILVVWDDVDIETNIKKIIDFYKKTIKTIKT